MRLAFAPPFGDLSLAEFRTPFAGELIRPGEAGYTAHRRVWNGSIDRHQALIARCTGVPDVQAPWGAAH